MVNGPNGTIKPPQLSDLMNAPNKTAGLSLAWSGVTALERALYAPIQEFIFDKWLEFEKPMIVRMALWKNGTPKGGISSI